MNFDTIENTLRVQFDGDWVAANPTIPISHEDVSFTPVVGDPWIRFQIVFGQTSQISTGRATTRRIRILGLIIIGIFTPMGDGSGLNNELGESAANLLELKNFSQIQMRVPRLDTIGERPPWYQQNVVTAFFTDIHL